MQSVRQTARSLRLRTDASARFERGLDPTIALDAAARATQIMLEICPGSKVTAFQDVYPRPIQRRRVTMPVAEIERLLGVAYEPGLVRQALDRLGFAPEIVGDVGEETLTVRVPAYRTDVSLPADVVEEVARIIGYETLPETLPLGRTTPVQRDAMTLLQRRVRRLLVAAGAAEAITYVTLSELEARQVGSDDSTGGFLHQVPYAAMIRLRNPVQSDRGLMRPTLVPSLLAVASENMKHETGVRCFELARVYLPGEPGALPHEAPVAAIVMTGQRDPVDRFATSGEIDFFDLKGVVEAILAGLGITTAAFAPIAHPALHPGRAASVTAGDRQVGLLGELRPDRAAAFGLEDGRVAVAELDLERLLPLVTAGANEIRVPKYLPVQQDFAVVVTEETAAAEVERALLAGGGALATGISLFDIYRGPQLGDGRKSLAYRVTFTAPDRALTDAELGKVRQRIAKVVAQRVGGEPRA
ncbi:MAG: phenylalanine--tRNA ligase subunit beta, partial [Chloroflexota bacterium]|nr:phenylalanine--tRNA ligase subunit beta [Chloroflexota bacterium]